MPAKRSLLGGAGFAEGTPFRTRPRVPSVVDIPDLLVGGMLCLLGAGAPAAGVGPSLSLVHLNDSPLVELTLSHWVFKTRPCLAAVVSFLCPQISTPSPPTLSLSCPTQGRAQPSVLPLRTPMGPKSFATTMQMPAFRILKPKRILVSNTPFPGFLPCG